MYESTKCTSVLLACGVRNRPEPLDLAAAGDAIGVLLADAAMRRSMGEKGYRRVVEQFLADRHLEQYAALLVQLLEA